VALVATVGLALAAAPHRAGGTRQE
jgi:hypothetical protein